MFLLCVRSDLKLCHALAIVPSTFTLALYRLFTPWGHSVQGDSGNGSVYYVYAFIPIYIHGVTLCEWCIYTMAAAI